ncbi:MAG: hypothetical protein ABSE44_18815 [Candidatus Sulfotelmatobacter sp.]|jgi:hypothetical protein
MKMNRVWIEIFVLGTAVACGLALLFATLGAAAGVAVGQVAAQHNTRTEQAYSGMVTCSRCGAKHPAALGQSATTCTRACVHGGASFSLIDGDASYLLDGDLGILKRIAGQRARILGTLHGNTITISSISDES